MTPFEECRIHGRREGVVMGLWIGAAVVTLLSIALHVFRIENLRLQHQEEMVTQHKALSLMLNECKGIAVALSRDQHGTVLEYETLRGYNQRAMEIAK